MICVPIIARSQSEVAERMNTASAVADIVELRLDYAQDIDLRRLIENRPCPVIVANRPKREGGNFVGEESDRIALLQKAIDLGADYVDVEFDSVGKLVRRGDAKLIVSHHDFDKTPEDIARIHAEIVRTGADIAKVAFMARDIRDNLRLFDLLRATEHPTIALCMGELGLISRIAGRKFGNLLTFAALSSGEESAPGQITVDNLTRLYRYRSIGPDTTLYGVIANPVAHSLSPAVHNAAFDALELDAVYLPFKVEGNPSEFVKAFRVLDIHGYSVTLPHKEAILPAMDELDALVRRVGALNTVVNRAGKLYGTNTDIPAAVGALVEALTERTSRSMDDAGILKGRKILLIGAGGAARALAFGLASVGSDVIVANRTHERAVKLAGEVGCSCCRLSEIGSCEAEILINTTSVGMMPNVDESPVLMSVLRKGMVVFDAVYNPPETRLLREAKTVGCRTVNGIAWFLNQAAMQFELWAGLQAPREIMERVIRERLTVSR